MDLLGPTRGKRRPVAEINIVPYVDVMLVLLVIFMVTTPLLTQGVKVDLPQGQAEPLPQEQKPPLVISVDAQGAMYLDSVKQPLNEHELLTRVAAELKLAPERSVAVRGHAGVEYGAVVHAMVLLQKAGVSKVGLITQNLEGH
jgi:biopolymer transport protein TolR